MEKNRVPFNSAAVNKYLFFNYFLKLSFIKTNINEVSNAFSQSKTS